MESEKEFKLYPDHSNVCSLCSELVGNIVHQTCVYCNDNSQWSEVCVRQRAQEHIFLCILLRMKCAGGRFMWLIDNRAKDERSNFINKAGP